MGKETGFLEIDRQDRSYADPKERVRHYKEFIVPHAEDELQRPGLALHELRHSVLPQRLSGEQP